MRLSPEQLCRLTAGRLEGDAPAGAPLAGITTDSRSALPGGAFVAVRGEHEDGHAYIGDAAQRGAALAMVAEERGLEGSAPPLLLRVDDPNAALRRACSGHLAELGCSVVGVTGSVGKTTAKEMIAHLLAGGLRAARTPGNLNTWTGVPCSVLTEDDPLDAYVVEMAMSAPGEIRDLAAMTRPTVGVLLNVGLSHLELLGSREAIADAKAELLEALPADGCAVLNADDERVRTVAYRSNARIAWFGLDAEDAQYTARDVVAEGMDGTRLVLVTPAGEIPARIGLPGRHLVGVACAATATAMALGVPLADIAERLPSFGSLDRRGRLRRGAGGALVYDDSYNSAPSSLAAALDVLAQSGSEERVAVIGDMLELGEETAAAHAEAGRHAARAATVLVAVGAQAARVVAGAIDVGMNPGRTWAVADKDEVVPIVVPFCTPRTTVLVKASNRLHLDAVVDQLVGAAE